MDITTTEIIKLLESYTVDLRDALTQSEPSRQKIDEIMTRMTRLHEGLFDAPPSLAIQATDQVNT